eukprot:CAMPEP_0196224734 /NCGR_PEP_ID=MMETSP0912-20130531/49366_1 /TAXON_ID=49265 /ORGANISM="Thalassiosira rotula, Strain GSO102" /LENGTH=311 /DNA_ID=CAMNT_0041504145 /DNA_START=180 /DNA_END=1115 /DNA_ORIENTATION=+
MGTADNQVLGSKRKKIEVEPVAEESAECPPRRKSPRLSNSYYETLTSPGAEVENGIDETFNVHQKIFAWDKGRLYIAKVLKCRKWKNGNVKCFVHFLGYTNKKWLAMHDIIKYTPKSRKFYEEFSKWAQEDEEKDASAHDTRLNRCKNSTKNNDTRGGKRRTLKIDGESTTMGVQDFRRKSPRLTPGEPDTKGLPDAKTSALPSGGNKSKTAAFKSKLLKAHTTSKSCLQANLQKKDSDNEMPKVGMSINVKFDCGETYRGKITRVKTQGKKKPTDTAALSIQIQYDDGDIENTTYPDPDITLVPSIGHAY